MKPGAWKDFLLPKEPENDPSFREEIAPLSVVGMRVIAAVSAGTGVLAFFLLLKANNLSRDRTPGRATADI